MAGVKPGADRTVRKRVRTPHYISGIGDGNVRNRGHEIDVALQNIRRRGDVPRVASNRLDSAYHQLGDDTFIRRPVRESLTTESNPWQLNPAIILLLSIVVLTALFLHIISDAQKTTRQQFHSSHSRHRAPIVSKKTRKKKTDEWSADSEEALLSASLRSHSTDAVADETVRITPTLYYPYQQPEPGLQQHRHRKPSAAAPAVGAVGATAAANAAAATSYAQPQQGMPQKSYYVTQSGSSVAYTCGGSTPVSARLAKPIVNVGSASPIPLPVPEQKLANSSLHEEGSSPYAPPRIQLQRPAILSHVLSSASSFESSFEELPNVDEATKDTAPARSVSQELHSSPKQYQSQVKHHLLLSPGFDDNESHDQTGPSRKVVDIAAATPRMGNRGRYGPPQYRIVEPPQFDTISESSDTYKFASPPRGEEEEVIPFLPNLEASATYQPIRPPKSINIDDLHLYQMMESGNMSHWEARVAEESRRLESQVKNASLGSAKSNSSGDSDGEIPSNDPRKSIHHKRTDLTASTDAASSLQGAIDFSELKLIDVIGGGGFGQVWKANWRGTPVAVKVLTGSAQSKKIPKAVMEEFIAEINLLKGMRHPNICLYMGACLDPPNRAIITELAANGSLWDALRLPLMPPFLSCDGVTRDAWPLRLYLPDARHGAPPSASARVAPPIPPRDTWPWELVRRVACGAARGMAYLHSGKPPVLHRDLKSANILLDESYTAKVCDFGLSRLKAQERSMTGNCGTVQWMAPEVLANMSYNEKADVYSYGIICWELLSRQCPYDGMTPIQCALSVLNRNQRPEIPKWCPPPLHALIRSCMKKDPDERPTFTQIILALDSIP